MIALMCFERGNLRGIYGIDTDGTHACVLERKVLKGIEREVYRDGFQGITALQRFNSNKKWYTGR